MALSVSFTTTQVDGASQNIVLTDGTTGSDVTAVGRRIIIRNVLNKYLNEDYVVSDTEVYIDWPIADGDTITITDIIANMQALNITLMYVNSGGASVAQDTELCGFPLYGEAKYYELTQAQAAQNTPPPVIIQDSDYFMNKLKLRVAIDSGNQAISLGGDISSAQNCYNIGNFMVENSNDFF